MDQPRCSQQAFEIIIVIIGSIRLLYHAACYGILPYRNKII